MSAESNTWRGAQLNSKACRDSSVPTNVPTLSNRCDMEVSDVPTLKDKGDVIPSESYQIVSGKLRGLLELSLTLPELYPTVNSGVSSEGRGDFGEGVANGSGQSDDFVVGAVKPVESHRWFQQFVPASAPHSPSGFEGLACAQFVKRCAVVHAHVEALRWAQQFVPVSAQQPEELPE